jgi:hypothetical protein
MEISSYLLSSLRFKVMDFVALSINKEKIQNGVLLIINAL